MQIELGCYVSRGTLGDRPGQGFDDAKMSNSLVLVETGQPKNALHKTFRHSVRARSQKGNTSHFNKTESKTLCVLELCVCVCVCVCVVVCVCMDIGRGIVAI